MANVFHIFEMGKESLDHIEKALQQKYTQQDKGLKTQLFELKIFVYHTLKLYDNTVEECNRAIRLISPTESDLEQVTTLSVAYRFKGNALYEKTKELDSLRKYLDMDLGLLTKHPEKSVTGALIQSYHHKAHLAKESNQSDSILYYTNKALELHGNKNDIGYCLSMGTYYKEISDYHKALEYHLKAYDIVKKYGVTFYDYISLYKNIYELYGKLGNPEKEKEFLQLYAEEGARKQKNQVENMNYALEIIGKEGKKKEEAFRHRVYISTTVLTVLVSLLLVYLTMKQRRKRKLIRQQEAVISVKEEENQILQQKVNESFEEVIALAQSGNSEFFARFQEVYPEIVAKLKEINPKFRISELTLCAYIFLGFTTKDIAAYTFTSIYTVKARKYNLRKKLNIPVEEGTEIWFRNLGREA